MSVQEAAPTTSEVLAKLPAPIIDIIFAYAEMYCKGFGIPVVGFEMIDLMVIGGKAILGSLAGNGFLPYTQFHAIFSRAAETVAVTTRDPHRAVTFRKWGFILDVIELLKMHFTPMSEPLAIESSSSSSTAKNGALFETLAPHSPEARRWASELNSPLQFPPEVSTIESEMAQIDAATIASQPFSIAVGNGASEAEIRAILSKPRIDEGEAAILYGKTRKALANDRRNPKGIIPRNTYCQKCEHGKVSYVTKEFVAFLENGPQKAPRR